MTSIPSDALEDLVDVGRCVVAAGLSPGSSGNISRRVGDDIWISAGGSSLGQLNEDSLSLISLEGEWIGGPKPSKEGPLHVALYRKNPDHHAVVHVHSPCAVAASCLAPWAEHSALPPLTPYFVMRAGQTPLIPYRRPGSDELGPLLLEPELPFRSALLQNHGQITSGSDLDAALDAAVEVEEAARVTMLTSGHERRLLTDKEIADLTARYGTPWTVEEG